MGHAANRILFPPTLSEYNRALHSLGAKKRGHLMMQVLGDMKGDGIAPDQETYRLIIETCAQARAGGRKNNHYRMKYACIHL